MVEGCREWNADLWIGLVDFENTFDSVEHEMLWRVLEDQGVEQGYIQILKHLLGDFLMLWPV